MQRLRAVRQGLPEEGITGEAKQPHVIDQVKCIRCGACFDSVQSAARSIVNKPGVSAETCAGGGR